MNWSTSFCEVGVNAVSAACSNHGECLSGGQCRCDYGWGSRDCSVGLVDKIGALYGFRWCIVTMSILVCLFALLRLHKIFVVNKYVVNQSLHSMWNTRTTVLFFIAITMGLNAAN